MQGILENVDTRALLSLPPSSLVEITANVDDIDDGQASGAVNEGLPNPPTRVSKAMANSAHSGFGRWWRMAVW